MTIPDRYGEDLLVSVQVEGSDASVSVGYRDGGRSTICDRSWPICRLRAWASIKTTCAVGPAGQDESLWWAAPISN